MCAITKVHTFVGQRVFLNFQCGIGACGKFLINFHADSYLCGLLYQIGGNRRKRWKERSNNQVGRVQFIRASTSYTGRNVIAFFYGRFGLNIILKSCCHKLLVLLFDNLFGVRLNHFGELACFLVLLLFGSFRSLSELETAVRHFLLHVLEISVQVRVLRDVAILQHKFGNTVLLSHFRNLRITLRLRFLFLHFCQFVGKRLDTSCDTIGNHLCDVCLLWLGRIVWFRWFWFRILDRFSVFQSMLLLVVGNSGSLRLSCTEITIVLHHVLKRDTLNDGGHLRFVRYTLCLFSGNSGKCGSIHPSEFLL
nr:MAG TPA: hypothetical protein [Caudoviricetes sp.]